VTNVKGMKGVWYKSHDDVYAAGEDRFFVAKEVGSSKKPTREFSSYPTAIDFYHSHIEKGKKPSFHELIPAWRHRRVHFDIDADVVIPDIKQFVTDILNACADELQDKQIVLNPEEVIVLDSSNEQKTSIHIILSTILTPSATHCKEFCKNVTYKLRRKVDTSRYDYMTYIDMGIYQRNRCFRLPFCTKRGQTRYLLPISFSYNGKEYDHGVKLPKESVYAMSVVGAVSTQGMSVVEYNVVEEGEVTSVYTREIDQQECDLILQLMQRNFTQSEWCFNVRKCSPGRIELERQHPGPCRVCAKMHGSDDGGGKGDNAYLRITNDGKVLFVCWRRHDEPLYIDKITRTVEVSEKPNVQGAVSKRYLDLPHHPEVARTSEDYIAALVGKFGHIE